MLLYDDSLQTKLTPEIAELNAQVDESKPSHESAKIGTVMKI